mgnify:CR=1 FL=1
MILSTSCQKRLLWQGKTTVKYIKGELAAADKKIDLVPEDGVRYTVTEIYPYRKYG